MPNLLQKASIVLTPTAYNDGEVLCAKPDDGGGDFDFSRNSAATRVNAQGLVENVQILSSNLVQNGDFSEEGAEEVSNGSFSQEGSELITNGDFSSDTAWGKEVGWSISDGSLVANSVTTGLAFQSNIVEANKFYKATYDVVVTSGSIGLYFDGGTGYQGIATTTQTVTVFFKATTASPLYFRSDTSNFTGSIDNVSVREVGQDWELQNGWSIGNDVAVFSGTASAYRTIYKQSILTIGKIYKLTFDIVSISSGSIENISQSNPTSYNTQGTITEYFTASSVSLFLKPTTDADCSITNISVKEVGQNWSFSNVGGSFGWRIANDRAICDAEGVNNGRNINSSTTLVNGKTYKLTLDILQSVDGMNVIIGGTTLPNELPTGTNLGYEYYIDASQHSGGLFSIYGGTSDLQEIDNISIIEITDDTNLPRINYEGFSYDGSGNVVPGSGCGSWLLEGQSTNLITYSEDFSNSSWSKGNITVASGFTSPDGTNNAYKLTNDAVTGNHFLRDTITVTSGEVYTLSLFVKKGTRDIVSIADGFNVNILANFDLTNGTVTNVSATSSSIEGFNNGWYRCMATITPSTNNLGLMIFSSTNYAGRDESGDFYVWGAQLENQSYATSYIPTSGSTVTRNQDVCTNGGSLASINSTEGVLYAEVAALADTITDRHIVSISDGTTSNRVYIGFGNASNLIEGRSRVAGVNAGFTDFVVSDETEFHKIAYKWKLNDYSLWVDGVEVDTSTGAVASANTLNTLNFNNGVGANIAEGKVKAVAVWKEALSDQELADLTYPTPTDPTFALDFDTIATDFTFARGSEATYVDAQGLIQSTNELGPELVTNGDFATDTDWLKGPGWSISGGIATLDVRYGGSSGLGSTAMSVTPGKTYKVVVNVISKSSGFRLYDNNGVIAYGLNVGENVFYRTVTSSSYQVTPLGLSGSTGSIDSVSVKEYITATNTPRLDYSTGAEAFLLEPQSTNLITYSSDFTTGTGWGEARCTLDSNVLISPDGQQTASELTDTTAPGDRGISQINSSLASNDYALFSMFLKAGTNRYGLLYLIDNAANINGGANSFTIVIDLQDGIITDTGIKQGTPQNTTYGIESYNNGWYRVYIGLQKQGNATRTDLRFLMYNSSTWSAGQGYVGDGTGTNYIWGGQLEAQSYPTSYIPSNGSQTTRNQETCINATPEINSEEGVLYAEISALEFHGYISISDGTSGNSIRIGFVSDTLIKVWVYVGNSQVISQLFTYDTSNMNKIAVKYSLTDFKVYINGSNVFSTSSVTFPIGTLSKLAFRRGDQYSPFFGNTKDIQVYTKALSDAELIKLTT